MEPYSIDNHIKALEDYCAYERKKLSIRLEPIELEVKQLKLQKYTPNILYFLHLMLNGTEYSQTCYPGDCRWDFGDDTWHENKDLPTWLSWEILRIIEHFDFIGEADESAHWAVTDYYVTETGKNWYEANKNAIQFFD